MGSLRYLYVTGKTLALQPGCFMEGYISPGFRLLHALIKAFYKDGSHVG